MNEPCAEWSAVDSFVTESIVRPDAALSAALAANRAAQLPAIDVSPPQGMLLRLLAQAIGARRVLEIGALGGYSTIWLGRALPPDGRLVSLELDPHYADVARANLARAGLSDVVEIRVGPALDELPRLLAEGGGTFDLVFIDADKTNCTEYFLWALRCARRGGVIIVDNVVRNGEVIDDRSADPSVQGVRRFCDELSRTRGVLATIVQTVGAKGYDGFALAVVTDDSPGAT